MRHVLLVLLLTLLFGGASVLVIGCGDSGSKAEIMPLEQVPESLLKTAKEKLPTIKFDHARKLPNGNYEVRGKAKNGKIREVEMTPSGKVVEIE